MKYVSGIILVSVICGLVSILSNGYRLSKTVKIITSSLIILTVINPLLKVISEFDPKSFFNIAGQTDYYTENDAESFYLESCRLKIGENISERLTLSFGDYNFETSVILDTEDISAVEISSVCVTASAEASGLEKNIITCVSELTACRNVYTKFEGAEDE